MNSIRRFLGLDKEGKGVSPSTSLLYSMVLSLIISFLLRVLFPTMSAPLRFVLFFAVVFAAFRWIDKNHRANKKR